MRVTTLYILVIGFEEVK